jgi:hypothetical protein
LLLIAEQRSPGNNLPQSEKNCKSYEDNGLSHAGTDQYPIRHNFILDGIRTIPYYPLRDTERLAESA